MKRWLRTLLFLIFGGGIALAAPIIPQDQKALIWYEPYKGAETCFAQYSSDSADVKELPCEEYWRIARTPNHPQPHRTVMTSATDALIADASISFDASTLSAAFNGTSVSFSHTVAGTNRALVVSVAFGGFTDANRDLTAATYNGDTLTSIRRDDDSTNDITTEMWYMVAPDLGSNTVALTFAGFTPGIAAATSLKGVDPSNPLDASNGTTDDNTTTVSHTLTTVADNSWIIDVSVGKTLISAGSCEPNSGQTEMHDDDIIATNDVGCFNREGPITPAAGQTVSESCSGASCSSTTDWAATSASFAPFVCDPSTETCTEYFDSPGYTTWTVPADVTAADISCWGGGGGGHDDIGDNAGGGGGGGAAFASSTLTVTPSDIIRLFIGSGGTEDNAGATSTASTTAPALLVAASPGYSSAVDLTAGVGGLAANSTGTTKSNGGDGSAGNDANDASGGGGGAGGPHGAGATASASGADGGTGGQGDNGQGGAGGADTGTDGSNGTSDEDGGGGGGGGDNGGGGGNGGSPGAGGGGGEICDVGTQCEGADGQCKIVYGVGISVAGGESSILYDQTDIWVIDEGE